MSGIIARGQEQAISDSVVKGYLMDMNYKYMTTDSYGYEISYDLYNNSDRDSLMEHDEGLFLKSGKKIYSKEMQMEAMVGSELTVLVDHGTHTVVIDTSGQVRKKLGMFSRYTEIGLKEDSVATMAPAGEGYGNLRVYFKSGSYRYISIIFRKDDLTVKEIDMVMQQANRYGIPGGCLVMAFKPVSRVAEMMKAKGGPDKYIEKTGKSAWTLTSGYRNYKLMIN